MERERPQLSILLRGKVMRVSCLLVCLFRSAGSQLLLACFLLALAAGRLPAQSTYGAILGTVRDSSGALVQGAQVTLVNTGTTARQFAATDGSGNYAFKNIDVGTYALTIYRARL